MTSLYDELQAAGCELDHHESDLYVKVSPEANAILAKDPVQLARAQPFTSEIDGTRWLDIPFAYAPWWRDRGCDI